MKYCKKIVLIFCVFITFYSCSTKKDTIISRNYHTLTTKYNVLFNGKESFKKGVKSINDNYKDDWFQQLPIEPIKFEEDKIVIPKYTSLGLGAGFENKEDEKEKKEASTPFTIAEDKAVKAIQKHGMNINGKERNRQIDDAYLLLGMARYYDQRFIPAIEAFNYIITNYPNANLINETKIWKAKANIRIDNEEFAIESMKLLLQVKDTIEVNLPEEIKEQGYTTLAMAYIKSDSIQKAKRYLIKATEILKDRTQGARNLFVLGQIYSLENKKDSAFQVFKELVNFKKAPYKYRIHANIELAKNTVNDSSSIVVLEKIKHLIKDRDNRAYLDELYYQVGYLHEKRDSVDLAIESYKKSLRVQSGGVKQKTFTYEKLGNIYFENSKYQLAGAYFDSVLKTTKDTLNLRIRRVKRKYKNLAALINLEEVVTKNDSILKIALLPKEEQEAYFKKYIEDLKKKDEEAAQLKLNQQAFGASFGGSFLDTGKKGSWYFYNSQALSFGQEEFKKIWGNRALADNWRWSSKRIVNSLKKDSLKINQIKERYDLASYLKTIPTEKKEIDSLRESRNEALYELGVIYKEQFKDLKIAISRLERLVSLNPKKELILPINWHLYRAYKQLGDTAKEEEHKNIILTDYTDTKFAQIIRNPDAPLKEEVSEDVVEKLYKETYYLYKEGKYEEVVGKINQVLTTIKDSSLLPKFELLKAYAIGKYKTKKEYEDAMDFVSVNYGNTEEGKKAKEITKRLTNK